MEYEGILGLNIIMENTIITIFSIRVSFYFNNSISQKLQVWPLIQDRMSNKIFMWDQITMKIKIQSNSR